MPASLFHKTFLLALCFIVIVGFIAACGEAETDAGLDFIPSQTADGDEDTAMSENEDEASETAPSVDGDEEAGVEDDAWQEEEAEESVDEEPDRELPPQVTTNRFKIRESVEQLHIWGANPETALELLDFEGELVTEGVTDYQGSLLFRELTPGWEEYTVRLKDEPEEYTNNLTVMSIEGSLPDESFYASQTLEPGFGYLETRDGTMLSIFVSLPGPIEEGPYPTVVNYSGYTPSRPGKSMGGTAELFCDQMPVLCDAPNHPFGIVAGTMGYATVGVNMRGTACSGGAYDYFEPLQLLDGYDIIETVARQSWVKHNKVGMVGLSYPGISQLFVASTNPPSLAAIAPFSVIADTFSSTLLPGGIYNTGFALTWIEMVLNRAEPNAHGWVRDLIDEGDTICEENQLLHSQKLDAIQKALDNPYYSDEIGAPVNPASFVHKINVPVFMVGHLQDEQTGPHFPILFDKFTSAPVRRFTMTNGVHADGFAPQILGEWANFQSFYVDQEIPALPGLVSSIVPLFMEDIFGATGLSLPPDRFADYENFEAAKADYEAEGEIRVIFETGASENVEPAGAPEGTFERIYQSWPLEEIEVLRYYLHPDGSLQETLPPEEGGFSEFEHDPEAGDRVLLGSGSVDVPQPDWDYRPLIEGKALAFVTDVLEEDTVLVGSGSVDMWLKSTADDADLEACITEVRPDGQEMYVQCGWLRASHRTLLPETSELRPVSSHYEEDCFPLVADEWNELRLELMPMSHIFRAGSRIRISIDTPGDSRAWWQFMNLEYEDEMPIHSIAHQAAYPSSVALPLLPEFEVETPMPECPAMRGQPCRTYQPLEMEALFEAQ